MLFNLKGSWKITIKIRYGLEYLSLNEYYIKHIDEKELFNFLKIYMLKNLKKKLKLLKMKKYYKVSSSHFLKNKAKTLEDIYQ